MHTDRGSGNEVNTATCPFPFSPALLKHAHAARKRNAVISSFFFFLSFLKEDRLLERLSFHMQQFLWVKRDAI